MRVCVVVVLGGLYVKIGVLYGWEKWCDSLFLVVPEFDIQWKFIAPLWLS